MTDDRLDPRRVQATLVAMAFDAELARKIVEGADHPGLSPRELAELRTVDVRALAADPFRRARALSVLLDEYPVTAAILGVKTAERFFSTDAFREVALSRGSMAVAFGQWIGERAHGIGRLEAAMASVRRARPVRGEPGSLVCAPHLRACVVGAGTLAYYERQRARLGPEPAARLAKGELRMTERPPSRGSEHLVVERREDGSIDLGTGSPALVGLLTFAHTPRRRAAIDAEAVRLGAEAHEVAEIVDDLLAQSLLVVLGDAAPPR